MFCNYSCFISPVAAVAQIPAPLFLTCVVMAVVVETKLADGSRHIQSPMKFKASVSQQAVGGSWSYMCIIFPHLLLAILGKSLHDLPGNLALHAEQLSRYCLWRSPMVAFQLGHCLNMILYKFTLCERPEEVSVCNWNRTHANSLVWDSYRSAT